MSLKLRLPLNCLLQPLVSSCLRRGALSCSGAVTYCTGERQIPTTFTNDWKGEKLPNSASVHRARRNQKHIPSQHQPSSSSYPADRVIDPSVTADKSNNSNDERLQYAKLRNHSHMERADLLSSKLIGSNDDSNDSAEVIKSMRIHNTNSSSRFSYDWSLHKQRTVSSQRDRAYCAWKFGAPLIFDMSFTQKPNLHCSLGLELLKCYKANLSHVDPFYIYFTDLSKNSESEREFNSVFSDEDMISFYSGSFLDLFPKEKLVYLTPYARATIEHGRVNDDVYIVGGLVDTFDEDLRSLVRAKEMGIRTASLPLHHIGSPKNIYKKALPLDMVVRILLEIQLTGRRDNIYKVVPKRYFWEEPETDMGHNYWSQSKGDHFELDTLDFDRKHRETVPDDAQRKERKGRYSKRSADISAFQNLKEKNNKGR